MSNQHSLTANPAPLGLCGFALTTWLLSLINNGTFSGENVGLVLAMGFAFGGLAQMLAGLSLEQPRFVFLFLTLLLISHYF